VRKKITLDEVADGLDEDDVMSSVATPPRPILTRAAPAGRRARRGRPLALGALGVAAMFVVVALGVPRPTLDGIWRAPAANGATTPAPEPAPAAAPTPAATVAAAVATERRDRPSYRWFLDADEADEGMTLPPVAGAAAPAVQRVSLPASREPRPAGARAQMSDADVRAWLARVETAWEAKDLTALRRYGAVATEAEAHALATWLARQDGYRVSIDLDSIRTHGRFGEVVFYRADFNGAGRMLLTARESYTLEKLANGSVTVRGR
jgi:hypothetical protein